MSAMDIFRYAGQQVRTVIVDGEPWFVASDVARILDLSNSRMAVARLDEDGVSSADVIDSMGRTQTASIVSESGLYELIFQSRKPEAKDFKRWVTREVLPSIRRTGQFGSQVPSSLAEALELAAFEARKIEALEAKAAADAPKVAAYDQLMDADGFYTMEAVAKLGRIGRTTLFNRLRDAGVIQSGSRMPYQRFMHWFKITTSTWTDSDGIVHPTNTPRVLPEALTKVLAKAGVELEVSTG